jgi:hypothetical protein
MKVYVREIGGHNVPHGATHYRLAENYRNRSKGIEFYRILNGEYQYFALSKGFWCAGGYFPMPHDAIEIPEEDQLEPVDGIDFQVIHCGELVSCLYIKKDCYGDYVYQVTEGLNTGDIGCSHTIGRLAKTGNTERVEREAFAKIARNIYESQSIECGGNDFIYALFDQGFTAPEK